VQKLFLLAAGIAGLTAIILGAFGAHMLQTHITHEELQTWDKGVQYQLYHSLSLFMCYLFLRKEPSVMIRNAGICFVLGILCFSGSLYLLATRDLTNISTLIIGPLTPIGGFFFIAGWCLVLVQALKRSDSEEPAK
jgi:uncharacterized membrane protein YgdD (TMEM256/DUF423 family)